jgi:AbrB family looped-hinge helix DNA binding protein
MRITAKGQVTIPIRIREKLGLLPDTEVDFELAGNAVRIVKVASKTRASRGRAAVERLRGRAEIRMTTDQILALTRRSR